MSSENEIIRLSMKGLVQEADAQVEFEAVMTKLESIRKEYMNGTDKEQVAFITAFSVFGIDFGNSL